MILWCKRYSVRNFIFLEWFLILRNINAVRTTEIDKKKLWRCSAISTYFSSNPFHVMVQYKKLGLAINYMKATMMFFKVTICWFSFQIPHNSTRKMSFVVRSKKFIQVRSKQTNGAFFSVNRPTIISRNSSKQCKWSKTTHVDFCALELHCTNRQRPNNRWIIQYDIGSRLFLKRIFIHLFQSASTVSGRSLKINDLTSYTYIMLFVLSEIQMMPTTEFSFDCLCSFEKESFYYFHSLTWERSWRIFFPNKEMFKLLVTRMFRVFDRKNVHFLA